MVVLNQSTERAVKDVQGNAKTQDPIHEVRFDLCGNMTKLRKQNRHVAQLCTIYYCPTVLIETCVGLWER